MHVMFPFPRWRMHPLAGCNGTAVAVASWGRGEDGQLGHGGAGDLTEPRAIFSLLGMDVRRIACGAEYTVAVTVDSVYSWGW
jgi:alpha-tubulin suppressor-like RCC1 family protein